MRSTGKLKVYTNTNLVIKENLNYRRHQDFTECFKRLIILMITTENKKQKIIWRTNGSEG